MKKLLLLLILFAGTLPLAAETWTPVGECEWTDAIYSYSFSVSSWNVTIEQSDSRPTVFRMQPYSQHAILGKNNVYLYLHTENSGQIYFEPFVYKYAYDSNYRWYLHTYQRCPENGFDVKYYGKVAADGVTIEFPVGSFASDALVNDSNLAGAPSSSCKYSTEVHKIVFPEGILGVEPPEETWVNIGLGKWQDGSIEINGEQFSADVDFEKSANRDGVYRCKPFQGPDFESDYVYIHANNSEAVYLEQFSVQNLSTKQNITYTQSENAFGTLNDGVITIPAGAIAYDRDGGNIISSKDYIITLPEGYSKPIEAENGAFMGIVAFNDKVETKPIEMITPENRTVFTDFVNERELGNATLLYYAVDQSITTLANAKLPDNVGKVVLITFTDGLDQGSLAMEPQHRNSRTYAEYLSGRIASITVKGQPIDAYTIGLQSDDVSDEELFMYNLRALASKDENAMPVRDINGVKSELAHIVDNLNRQVVKRSLTITVPMMSDGDKYCFTLDGSDDRVGDNSVRFTGRFSIDNMSLTGVEYFGCTSASGTTLRAVKNGIYLTFTLNDVRDLNDNPLEITNSDIDQWQWIASKNIWQHNKENAKDEDVSVEDVRTSVAVMFALDCSSSLGDLFPTLKNAAVSFIESIAGGLVSSIDEVDTAVPANGSAEYYTLQGVRVDRPTKGIYIRRCGSRVDKILVK